MSGARDKFAVLILPGRIHKIIERRTDAFKDVYVVVAEATDQFEARKIAAALNREDQP